MDGWPVVRASGGPRERGRAYGEGARDRIHRSIELYAAIFLHYTELEWSEVRDRAGPFTDWFDATDVQLLPELEGIAEGAHVDAEDVLALNVRTEVMFGLDRRAAAGALRECTAVGARPPATDGRVLLGQTWDWKPAARDTCVLLAVRPVGRPAFVTFVEAGLLAKCGMNDAGIAVATNALTSSNDRGEPGVPYHAILRRLLTSSSFDDAVAEVTTRRRASSANYMIGSSDGHLADLEAAPGGADVVWRIEGATVAHANHFLNPDRTFKDLALIDGRESPARQASIERSLEARAIGVATIEDALRMHAGIGRDGSVCAHPDASTSAVADYVTIAGIVFDLAEASVHVTHGNPCGSPFEIFSVDALLGL
jgi:isopenicillin-N N-acyltransferase-like protein